ncbi:MAG: DUF4384 domain-containing protein [Pseudomonadota bacterium]
MAPAAAQTSTTETQPLTVEQRVRSIFERHCIGCHSEQAPSALRPGGGLARLRDLDWLAASHLVNPGDPDLSSLYIALLTQHAPQEIFKPFGVAPGPTPEEVAAVRGWIRTLPPADGGACEEATRRVSPRRLARAAVRYLKSLPASERLSIRFLSLAHLGGGCDAARRTSAFAVAVDHLLNGLTWRPTRLAARRVPVSADLSGAAVLLAIDLRDYGWDVDVWARMSTRVLTPRLRPRDQVHRRLRTQTGSLRPILNADAFAATVLATDNYAVFLSIPDTRAQFAALLGVRRPLTSAPQLHRKTTGSEVTGRPREIVRLTTRLTNVWAAAEVAPNETTADLAIARAGRWLFSLPNGTYAVATFDRAGKRLGPATGGRDASAGACLSCHARGPRKLTAEARPAVAARPPVEPDAVGAAEPERGASPSTSQSTPEAQLADSAAKLIEADQVVRPRIDGIDAVQALALAYRRPLNLRRAAAEYGADPAVFRGVLSERVAQGDDLARRMSLGALPREDFNRLMARMTASADPAHAADQIHAPPSPGLLTVWPDRARYRVGDGLQIRLLTTVACYPTVVSVGAEGQALILYPNDYQEQALLKPAAELRLPGAAAPFAFRLNTVGRERLLAFCAQEPGPIFGVPYDFQTQVFPILGPWGTFTTTLAGRYSAALNAAQLASAKTRRERLVQRWRRRSRRRRGPKPSEVFDARPKWLLRAGASYKVSD